jgi:hypothetical protein
MVTRAGSTVLAALVAVALTLAAPGGPGVVAAQSAVRQYPYAQLDVFTEKPLTGNQLAVFFEPQGLAADEMLAITREMGFSETTFVFPPERPDTAFRVRISASI